MGNAEVRKESPGRKANILNKPRGRISNEKGTRDAPTQSKGKKKKVSLNTGKKKEEKKEPDEGSTQKKRTLKCLSFDGLLGKLKVLKDVLPRNKNVDAHLVKNNSKSQGTVQPQFQAPAVPVENIATSILPPKKCPTYRMTGEGSSKVGTKASCRQSQRIAALHRAKNQTLEEHEVITLSSNSEHEKDKNLDAGAEEALLAAEDGAEETLPKNDVYAALWVILDAESENEVEEIPGQWDLDGVLNNWGKIEKDVGPAGNDQGPPPAAN
ncbi:hypothetical protein PIB30_045561 [Stylosanthes scabra]|uniref:Uncharacterized protein n=1 Tax=Stylosanthes scabra TaxID=79078 RepID=A0ABU6WHW0_9FABA|nr:hypothetical protein [Stylosanthes scabra]